MEKPFLFYFSILKSWWRSALLFREELRRPATLWSKVTLWTSWPRAVRVTDLLLLSCPRSLSPAPRCGETSGHSSYWASPEASTIPLTAFLLGSHIPQLTRESFSKFEVLYHKTWIVKYQTPMTTINVWEQALPHLQWAIWGFSWNREK